ncbi:MAG: hypothetical protein ISS33_06655 [Candidatus Omnitrophica bacterium]|nr:hypothetical protein [Candidatus Omnitrophota bacterium]
MSIVDTVKSLPNGVLALFIASKFVIGLGVGALLSGWFCGKEGWIILIGILMSVPGAYMMWFRK